MAKALVLSGLGRGTGCELRARHLAKALQELGMEVVYRQPPLPSLPYSLESLLLAPWHLWLALAHKPDLCVGIKPYPSVWLPLAVARVWGCVCVADVDDLDGAWRVGLVPRLSSLAQSPAYALLDRFSTHHPMVALRLARRGVRPGKVATLAQGVDPAMHRPGGPRVAPAVLEAAAQGRRVLLHPAHLNVASEVPLLLEWMAPWLAAQPGYVLVVAGGGPLQSRFAQQAQGLGLAGRVHFTGALDPEAAAAWMRSAWAVLCPYEDSEANQHRVPMKVLESLACGAKVLTQPIAGNAPFAPWLYMAPFGRAGFMGDLEKLANSGGDGREVEGARVLAGRRAWVVVAREFVEQL